MHYTTLISTEELAVQLDDPRLVPIDCRFSLADPAAGERAYREGHIPGARYAHLDRDLAGPITPTSGRHPLPERETFAACLGAWGVNGRTQAVVYDDAGGAFAARAWWLLRWLGHEKVAVLNGGLPQWRREARAESSETPVPVATVFPIRAPLVEVVDVEQLQGALARRAVLVMDARAPERFRGETEFIDPVAGHVPGAINHPLQNNLGHDGFFAGRGNQAGLSQRARRVSAGANGADVRLRRHRLPQRVGDGICGTRRRAALCRLVERVDPRHGTAGGARNRRRSRRGAC